MRGLKLINLVIRPRLLVASFTDAWIETKARIMKARKRESHLLQMRGLKHFLNNLCNSFTVSHLLQMRGLKHALYLPAIQPFCRIFYRCVDWNKVLPMRKRSRKQSHLLQMRGLKLDFLGIEEDRYRRIFYRCVDWNRLNANRTIRRHQVASFTDAWIETADNTEEYQPPFVASFTDAWIETVFVCHVWKRTDQVASFTDAWIETCNADTPTYIGFGRIFYRCVDWNIKILTRFYPITSHLLQMRGLKPHSLRYLACGE